MKAAELFDTEEDDEILLQGVADCFFEEKDGIVVLDYKTDAVFTDEEIRNRAEHYRAQILSYSAALERITGKKVKEKILCFLRPRKNITIL
jgi:ATP-dependent helicase/nuclease subunit A